jgi:hypothetical protein
MIQDTMQHQKHRITDDIDITTLKDYMQYTSLLDETPSYMGGRDNTWRRLTLDGNGLEVEMHFFNFNLLSASEANHLL